MCKKFNEVTILVTGPFSTSTPFSTYTSSDTSTALSTYTSAGFVNFTVQHNTKILV